MNEAGSRNILFVDDEPRVLRSIERGLRSRCATWNLSFSHSASEALLQMETSSFDIIVSDIVMPKTSGVELLTEVRKRHPDTIRILMSGAAEGETMMRAVPVAHRFLSKPWELKSLQRELERAFELRQLMSSSAIRTIVGGMDNLPVLPSVYTQICIALQKPHTRLDDVIAIVERDPAIVARLLQIVNSAFFAPPRPLGNASDAVRYLGTSLLKSLILSSEIFHAFDEDTLPKGFSLEAFQQHALLTAKIASFLVESDKDQALTAGLLHSVGKLIFASRLPVAWGRIFEQARKESRALEDLELEHFQTSYAEVGGYLLGTWGLPQDIVEAVAQHCDPMRSRTKGLGLVAGVHLASVLASEELGCNSCEFDRELLEALDGARAVDAWRSLSSQLAG